ncbi:MULTISPECIES: type IX secretion system membrane protein PorP/SprF [unclassified Tenacibaculum]|uniref:PorP/SprF family type IX secretion system membrane protein n=1 Tax=unclassified Tenacibaculum TaxID=2635139 RepID=UPI001F4261A5|nr:MULTISPECIES: type IX secretion system membrane protein PorP/SprF [unclassified Tenacibaculum]MCF2875588.1 type IX secretion system membrane protein PorP/SprF [Tenacibaculum sp. Cn5-1]MCF2935664.1 type IX secretion system membrane protein PorP/SprF [Tenacibaculum sp. Cn5-34]MCG7512224.1 type IX secretion system membrane protein PorP/SprF [Tenacibaculum sp. Cn5-46]
MKQNYRFHIIFILIITTVFNVESQQLPQFTQYMYNTISVNPAYAGSREVLSIVGLHRSQWAGFGKGPETQTLSIHTPLRNDRIGLGLSFINDKLGYENFTYLYGDFSYTINLSEETRLAFGLKAGFTQYNLDDELIAAEASDPGISGVRNRWEPNVGAGLYLHTNKWYLGLSAPRLLNIDHNDLTIGGVDYGIVDKVSYYLTAGYVFNLSNSVKFKPATLIKATNGAPLSYDVTANFLFNEKFWLGGSYRFNEFTGALGAIVDFQVSRQFRVGYAYEYPLSDINQFSSGTHEVLLMYELIKVNRVKSPRYF